jgi:hypothetical protein
LQNFNIISYGVVIYTQFIVIKIRPQQGAKKSGWLKCTINLRFIDLQRGGANFDWFKRVFGSHTIVIQPIVCDLDDICDPKT